MVRVGWRKLDGESWVVTGRCMPSREQADCSVGSSRLLGHHTACKAPWQRSQVVCRQRCKCAQHSTCFMYARDVMSCLPVLCSVPNVDMPSHVACWLCQGVNLNSVVVGVAATQTSSVRFVTDANNAPTAAILTGVGAQATFQNTAGQVIVVTSNSPGTVTIPIGGDGNPTIPDGNNLTVVSNNPNIPSTSSSSSPGGKSVMLTVYAMSPCSMPSVTVSHIESLHGLGLACSRASSNTSVVRYGYESVKPGCGQP